MELFVEIGESSASDMLVAGFTEKGDGRGENAFSENSDAEDGEAQPNNVPSLDVVAGDFGSGLLRIGLLFSTLRASIVACKSLSGGPRLKYGGGAFRENTDMVGLIRVFRLSCGSDEPVPVPVWGASA